MWTEITREEHRRESLRYASDMTEWAMVEPLIPAVKRLGRPRSGFAELSSNWPVICRAATARRRSIPSASPIFCAARGLATANRLVDRFTAINQAFQAIRKIRKRPYLALINKDI
jgi:putative transposase